MQGGIAPTLARLGLRERRAAPPESRFALPEARERVREYDRAALESRDGLREAEFALREHRFRLSEQQFRLSEGPARLRESKIRIREHRFRLRESRIRAREPRRGLREYRFGLPEYLRALPEHRRVIPEQLVGLTMVKICPTQALWTVRVKARARRSTRPARAATRRRGQPPSPSSPCRISRFQKDVAPRGTAAMPASRQAVSAVLASPCAQTARIHRTKDHVE